MADAAGNNPMAGQIFALFILTVAAAEAAVGLAILVVYFRNRGNIAVENNSLRAATRRYHSRFARYPFRASVPP